MGNKRSGWRGPKPQWFKDMVSKVHKGKIVSKETGDKISKAKKGQPSNHPWKGKHMIFTGATLKRLQASGRRTFELYGNPNPKGRHRTEAEKALISQKTKEGMKKWWSGLSIDEQIRIREATLKAATGYRRPTIPERLMDDILEREYPFEWKYTGNGKFIIGNKNPDFINVNGRKAVVEVLGDYWHPKEHEFTYPKHYAQYGFSCFIVWEHELKNNPELVVERLTSFMGGQFKSE